MGKAVGGGANSSTADEKNQVDEYAALMSGKGKGARQSTGNPLEDMLFDDAASKKSSGGCTVC